MATRSRYVPVSLFDLRVRVVVGDLAGCERALKRLGVAEGSAGCGDNWDAMALECATGFVVLFREDAGLDAAGTVRVVAHESVHLSTFILNYVGAHSDNDETQSYLVGYLTAQILRVLGLV